MSQHNAAYAVGARKWRHEISRGQKVFAPKEFVVDPNVACGHSAADQPIASTVQAWIFTVKTAPAYRA